MCLICQWQTGADSRDVCRSHLNKFQLFSLSHIYTTSRLSILCLEEQEVPLQPSDTSINEHLLHLCRTQVVTLFQMDLWYIIDIQTHCWVAGRSTSSSQPNAKHRKCCWVMVLRKGRQKQLARSCSLPSLEKSLYDYSWIDMLQIISTWLRDPLTYRIHKGMQDSSRRWREIII